MYIYLMENLKPLTEQIVKLHVDHLKQLKEQDQLVLCGPFIDYPGGMVVIRARDIVEATEIAQKDPFIQSGYKSFEIRTIQQANEENNYLLQ
jgi:uncharacterized protein YciI